MSAARDHDTFEAQIHAYFDGELTPADERAVLEHLADCARCQTTLDDLMGMQVALGRPQAAPHVATPSAAPAEVVRTADSKREAEVVPLAARRSRRGWAIVGAALAAAAAVVVLVKAPWRGRRTDAPPPVLVADSRPVEVRFSADEFAAHRPYRVDRGSTTATPIPLSTLSALERRGDRPALVAALVWSGDRARAATILEQEPESATVLADRAAVAVLAGDAEAALEAADRALVKEPAFAVARWNRALALRDLGLPLAAATELDVLAATAEPGWSTEAAERASSLRAEVEALRKARLDATARHFAAVRGDGPPLTAADVEVAPTEARHYFHDALRVITTAAELEALEPLAAALDQQSGGGESMRELRRVGRLDLARRARFVTRYRALAGGALSPADVDRLLRDLEAAGPAVDDIRLGGIILGRRLADRGGEVDRIAMTLGTPWYELLAIQQRLAARRPRPGDEARADAACVNPAWALRCATIEYHRVDRLAELGLAGLAEQHARRWLEFLEVGGTGVEEQGALFIMSEILRARGRLSLSAGYAEESLALVPADDCQSRLLLGVGLATIARWRGDHVSSRAYLGRPEQCPAGVDPAAIATAVDLARVTGDAHDAGLAEAWIAAGHQASLPVDYLHVARARLDVAREAGAREILVDVARNAAKDDRLALATADWAWRTIISDDGRRGDWTGAYEHTLGAVGQEQPKTCGVTLSYDEGVVTAAWRDGNGLTGGGQWREGEAAPAFPASARYGCTTMAVVAMSPLHGRPPLWNLGTWAWSTGRQHAAPAAGTRDAVVVAATMPPPAQLALPPLAPVPVPAGARGLIGADATPARVAAAMKTATYVEIHAHGLVDLDIDDGGFVALSPDARGDWRLTASDVKELKLAGAPVVVLAACRVAEAARDRLRRWSLPDAFLAAGARAVIAADVAVPDDLIRAFVDDVRGRLERGEAPAQAAAAARAALIARDASTASWVDRLMVFE